MNLRIAKKILSNPDRYSSQQVQRAIRVADRHPLWPRSRRPPPGYVFHLPRAGFLAEGMD